MLPTASSCLRISSALLAVSCAGRVHPAHFEGSTTPRRAEPEGLVELAARTAELQRLGTVHDSCALRAGYRRLERERLSDLDCSTERLRNTLREAAAAAGGEALIGVHCNTQPAARGESSATLTCAAEVARFARPVLGQDRPLDAPRGWRPSLPAPNPSEVKRIDEPDASLSFRIRLSFEPGVSTFIGRPRDAAEVRELSELPISDQPLGDLVASCEGGCDARALRYGVLIAAGRLGAPDVISVRCFREQSGDSCIGTLAAPERREVP